MPYHITQTLKLFIFASDTIRILLFWFFEICVYFKKFQNDLLRLCSDIPECPLFEMSFV